MPDSVPLCYSKPLRVRRFHLSWTDFHPWKAQGTHGEFANSSVLWQMPSRLHDDGNEDQVNVETLTHCSGVSWQPGQKFVPQCHAASHFVGNGEYPVWIA